MAASLAWLLASCASAQPLPSAPSPADAPAHRVHLIEITGIVNPLSSSYLQRALREAQATDAHFVIIRLDTPGGLDSATREMIQVMQSSTLPIVVYVAPAGARAASAGMFLALAAHVAAMAPGTNIGAAHPVSLRGEMDETMSRKVAQEAAAAARALADAHNRNPDWAEKAVLESVSLTNDLALRNGLVDLVAADMDDLLRQLDNRQITTVDGVVTLRAKDAQVISAPMNLAERLLHAVSDPNIAYLLLSLGALALTIEFQAPGFGLPGTVGVVSLVLAFVAFGNLPLSFAGIGLIVLGVMFLIAEALSPGFGAVGVAGLVFFAFGSLMLYRPLTVPPFGQPDVSLNPWIVAFVTAGLGALITLIVRKGVQSQRMRPISDLGNRLAGAEGYALTDLSPVGVVQVGSELWSAVCDEEKGGDQALRAGERVKVVAVKGVTLRVRRVNASDSQRLHEGHDPEQLRVGMPGGET